jgi:hypothetical protein
VDARDVTRRFDVAPCMMLVALGDREAKLCADLLKPLTAAKPLSVMRVAHIRAACERMLVTRPMIVVFSEALAPDEQKLLHERIEDIMAEAVVLPEIIDRDALKQRLFVALREANLKGATAG